MTKYSLLLGSYISVNKPNKYLLGAVRETIANNADCFMIFTGAPQNKNRVDLSLMYVEEAIELAAQNGIKLSNCLVHAPYLINLATTNEDNAGFSVDLLVNEIKRSVAIGVKLVILHPGFHNNSTLEVGIKNIIKNMKTVLSLTDDLDYLLCLENMAGKRNQIGKTLEELKEIIDGLDKHPKIAVCLDTCHLHDAGYSLSNKKEFLDAFERLIGVAKIKAIHLGDSMNKMGSRKDRHANLGFGYVGFLELMDIAYDPYLSQLPIIVETPYWMESGDKKKLVSPYKHEIEVVRKREFNEIPNKNMVPIFDLRKITDY